jgi:hypothetical protein
VIVCRVYPAIPLQLARDRVPLIALPLDLASCIDEEEGGMAMGLEYRTYRVPDSPGQAQAIGTTLNRMAAEGWVFHSAVGSTGGGLDKGGEGNSSTDVILIFQREQ